MVSLEMITTIIFQIYIYLIHILTKTSIIIIIFTIEYKSRMGTATTFRKVFPDRIKTMKSIKSDIS